jgi:hypothetical protein
MIVSLQEQEGQDEEEEVEEDDLRMGGQWRKTPRYTRQQGDPVPLSLAAMGSMGKEKPFLDSGVTQLIHLVLSCSFLRRVCAVLQDTTVAMYITVCYHQPARR